jgi:hypothetical protein
MGRNKTSANICPLVYGLELQWSLLQDECLTPFYPSQTQNHCLFTYGTILFSKIDPRVEQPSYFNKQYWDQPPPSY